jgi:hypothetical protein
MSTASRAKGGPMPVGLPIPSLTPKASATAEGGNKKSRYKSLPKEFRRDGFAFRQIARTKNAAIYEQTWNGCSNPSVCYEVIRIRRRDGFQIDGRFVEPAETYPNSQAWGTNGWTVHDKETAFRKLRELSKRLPNKKSPT